MYFRNLFTEKMLSQLENLKKLMMSNQATKKKKTPEPLPPDSDEVERRLLNETINEVVGLDLEDVLEPVENEAQAATADHKAPPIDCYSWLDIDIEERLKQHKLMPANGFKTFDADSAPTFADNAQSGSVLTPSLHRNITIDEPQKTDINNIGITEDFGDANIEELSKMGMFALEDSSLSKRIFDRIKSIEPTRNPSTPVVSITDERGKSIQVFEALPLNSLGSLDQIPADELPPGAAASLSRVTRSSVAAEIELPATNEPDPVVVAQSPQQEPSKFPPPSHSSAFEKIIAEDEELKKQAPKARRRPRPRPRERSRTPETQEFLEMNTQLKFHRRKKLVPRDFCLPISFHNPRKISDNDYQPDELEVNVEEAAAGGTENKNVDLVPLSEILGFGDATPGPGGKVAYLPHPRQSETPNQSPARNAQQSLPPSARGTLSMNPSQSGNDAPKLDSVRISPANLAKRARLENVQDSYQQPYDNAIHHPLAEVSQLLETPFVPTTTSTAQRNASSKPTIAEDVLEFTDWRQKSMQKEPSVAEDLDANKEKTTRRPFRAGNDDEYDENGNRLFRRVKGTYDTMIQFVGSDGKLKKCSQYSMEVI